MIQTKRYLNDDESFDDNTKKLQKRFDNNQTSTCFESLSNELFYEIFEYLDGCQLYEAFSNLNQRFQDLLACSALILKINLRYCHGKIVQNRYTDIVIPNRHKIISLRLPTYSLNDCNFTTFKLDSSFSHLEALTLDNHYTTPFSELERFLTTLFSLPRLVSLTVYGNYVEDIKTVYETIFKLPLLKYIKVSCGFVELTDLSMATNDQCTRIEHLVIGHCCRFNELIRILSYAPHLYHLSCSNVRSSGYDSTIREINTLTNLTHISIKSIDAKFNELERFLLRKSPQLQVLRMGSFENVTCLDANQWEQLISQYLTHLCILEFQCQEGSYQNSDASEYYEILQRFRTPFWIERKWFFKLDIDVDPMMSYDITYSICTNKKSSSDVLNNTKNDESFFACIPSRWSKYFFQLDGLPATLCTVIDERNPMIHIDHYNRSLSTFCTLHPILPKIGITCLNIVDERIYDDDLIDLIKHLPNLDSLAISSLSTISSKYLSMDDSTDLRLVPITMNKISKVKVRCMNELAQVEFLLNLCPLMRYFEIDCEDDLTAQTIIRFILMKHRNAIPHLSSLSLDIPFDDENIIENLQTMIDIEQLRQNYTIEKRNNRIYLQWN